MSDQYPNYKEFHSDHLWAVVEHAQSQIDMWLRRQQVALGHLAIRGEISEGYPEGLGEQA